MNMIRIQLDLPVDKVRELDGLMEEAHITTRKDLFNTALTLLAWVANERKEGRVIASLDERSGSYKELVMPFFSFLKRIGVKGGSTGSPTDDMSSRQSFEVKARGKTVGVLAAATSRKGREAGR